MRLAVISPFVDRRHGTERALAELLEMLAGDYGCVIHLYAERVEDLRLRIADSRPANATPASEASSGVIYWHKVPAIRGPHAVRFVSWMILNALCRRRDAWLGSVSYDLVLSPGINCLHPDVAIVHVLFHRLRDLSQEPGAPTPVGILRRWHRRLYYALLTALERRIYYDKRTQVAAVSQRTAGLLKQYCGRSDVPVIPNGVDTSQFCIEKRLAQRAGARRSRGFREDECVLLLIGNDWHTKGLPAVLEAMATLRDLPFRLLVVGSDVREYFQRQAEQLDLQHRCSWESAKLEVLDLYGAADVYVSPSREDSFGLPVAEAMACGLPVITSRFAGVAEMVRDGVEGFVLEDPQDVGALAELLARLASDLDLRRNTGAAAARRAAAWTWQRHASVVWELLRSRVEHESNR